MGKQENLGVRIDEADEMAFTREEGLAEGLISHQTSPSAQKWRILSYLHSNRKKAGFFLLFTLLKVVVCLLVLK